MSSSPPAPTIWELFHRLLQPPRRWSCRFKPLPMARRPLPGHCHQLRRHRTVSVDQLGHISLTLAATAPVGLLLRSTTTRPPSSATSGFVYRLFQQPRCHSRRAKSSLQPHEHRSDLHWPTFKDYYSVNACAYMYAAEYAHFTAAFAIPQLSQPTILGYYRILSCRAPTTSSANTPPSLVRARSSSTRFTVIRLQPSHHIFGGHHDVTVLRSERCSTP